jgi:hypothetical protein
MRLSYKTAHPQRRFGPTPEQAWASHPAITAAQRHWFRASRAHHAERERADRSIPPGLQFGHRARALINRFVDRKQLRLRYEAYCRQPAHKSSLSFKFRGLALEIWARRFESCPRLGG